ncbi:MAG: ABC transporter ATP-binding protein, partial [Candidatus Methanomethylophilaceae archaeon]|nr:ABC transporter ATP-binding protein [Candidatus Methanomethylophilaceae archaeon]
ALHDLNLALRFCDRIVMIKDGTVVSNGTPEEVLTSELIESVYGVRTTVTDTEQGRFILAYDSL